MGSVLKEQIRKLKETSLCLCYDIPGQSISYSRWPLGEVWAPSTALIFVPVPVRALPSNCKAYMTVDSAMPFIFYLIWQFSIVCDRSSALFSQTLSNNVMGTFVHSLLKRSQTETPEASTLAVRRKTSTEIWASRCFIMKSSICTCFHTSSAC